jgi:thioredoxin 1
MSANVHEFTDSNFATEVLQSPQPVLVDFWAPWCGPCRQIAPMMEQLASENAEAVKFGKVNIDENPQSAQEYGVMSIPTLLLFRDGQVTEKMVGARPKSQIQALLDTNKG